METGAQFKRSLFDADSYSFIRLVFVLLPMRFSAIKRFTLILINVRKCMRVQQMLTQGNVGSRIESNYQVDCIDFFVDRREWGCLEENR